MAARAEDGVVDDRCRVFAGQSGASVHPGLFVVDGSVIPTSVGSNPMLTICALAERAIRLLIAEEGWGDESAGPKAQFPGDDPAPADAPDRLHFTERMRGTVASKLGTTTPLEFVLTAIAPDLEAMAADPDHAATLFGTVSAPSLSGESLRVLAGRLCLFRHDPERVNTVQMTYTMDLVAPDGRRWSLHGVKQVHGWHWLQGWGQTTRLQFELRDSAGAVVGQGTLQLALRDFLRQLASWRVAGASSPWEHLRGTTRMVGMFVEGLRVAYGGPLAPSRRGLRGAGRQLALPAAVEVPVQAWDRETLRLIRYEGGTRGPVLLLHGFAANHLLFTHDTTELCLAEALVADGYDVWVGQWRGSGVLPAARRSFTLDDVAERDAPALIDKVLEVSGARALDIVAHCIGSRVVLMAMTAGHVRAHAVRSFLGLQVGLHWQNNPLSWLRAHSRLPDLLLRLGVKSVRADATSQDGLHYRALDVALKMLPTRREDRCANPSCRRNAAIWGQIFHHPNLRCETHDAICEMLGRTNIRGLAHLAAQMRRGFAVDAAGLDVYLPGLPRITCPTLLLYSEKNAAVEPGTTRRTFEALATLHPEGVHRWEIIPGYGHIDPLVGRDAHHDVFPRIRSFLAAQR